MSAITDFFIRDGEDHRSRTLDNILEMSDYQIEASHDSIQWMFPLHERSYHSTTAPVLTAEDIGELQNSYKAKINMGKMFDRICKFLGLGEHRDTRKQDAWCHAGNHNLLRVTRIIRSLRLFGLNSQATYMHYLASDAAKNRGIPDITFKYWDDALNEDLDHSMTARFLDDKRIDL